SGGGGTLSGKILIKDELKAKVVPGDTIFVIARKAAAGPPLAVVKMTPSAFPISYSLSQQNVMMPGMSFDGDVDITVRIDKDGDAMTKNPGDLFGKTQKPVTVGANNADVTIDTML